MYIGNDWDLVVGSEFNKPYYHNIRSFLKEAYRTKVIHPDMYHIYNALKLTPYGETKVVILGQDPYHGVGQAHGLCFSVLPGVKLPPSLANIYKELKDDVDFKIPNHGCLEEWARQGVLLLNAVLTVEDGKASSHSKIGWQVLTDKIIEKLNDKDDPVVFILWGNYAKSKKVLITNPVHFVIESVHPSPLSAFGGFFGSKPFSRTNEFLSRIGKEPIDWQITNVPTVQE